MPLHRLASVLCRRLGHALSGLVLNDVRLIERAGRARARKRRRWYAPLLILGGRLYVRLARAHVYALSERPWQAREIQLYRALYGETVFVDDERWLDVPRRGEALSLYLQRPDVSSTAARRAIVSATAELFRLHAVVVRDGSEARPFSHGDAGAGNVAYDAARGCSTWFDFEMVHPPGLPRVWRQADDLRALLFSALARVSVPERAETAAALVAAYPDMDVLAALQTRLAGEALDFDTYHLAQVRLGADEHQALRLLLWRALAETLAPGRNEGPTCPP
jgi:hypothetical protein